MVLIAKTNRNRAGRAALHWTRLSQDSKNKFNKMAAFEPRRPGSRGQCPRDMSWCASQKVPYVRLVYNSSRLDWLRMMLGRSQRRLEHNSFNFDPSPGGRSRPLPRQDISTPPQVGYLGPSPGGVCVLTPSAKMWTKC